MSFFTTIILVSSLGAIIGIEKPWMAEIELSALKGQCLDRRIADMDTMQTEVTIWENNRNNMSKNIDSQFTTADARIKLKRLYPNL